MTELHIAYLISAHTDAPQLKRLIEALHPDAHFFVHIDLKSDQAQFTSIIQHPNVHFILDRVDVRWGTMTEVFYQMALLRQAVQHPTHFDHIFFLSGMDYPLWSAERITDWLRGQQGRELLQGYCMDTTLLNSQQLAMYTLGRPYFKNSRIGVFSRHFLRWIGYRKPLHFRVNKQTWKLYKGSAWWCISQELAEFVLQVFDSSQQLRSYFRDSFCPAETLIQTIAFNSPQWASRCILTQGEYPGLDALTPLHFIDYNPVIKVLDETDYDRLMASGKMFCRKVVTSRSDKLVEMLRSHAG